MSGLLNFLSGKFWEIWPERRRSDIHKDRVFNHEKALSGSHLDEAVHKFIINVIRAVLYIVLTVVILGKLKVPTAPLVTVLGAAGAAIALASKTASAI